MGLAEGFNTVVVDGQEFPLARLEFCSTRCGQLLTKQRGCVCGREALGIVPQGTAQRVIQAAIDQRLSEIPNEFLMAAGLPIQASVAIDSEKAASQRSSRQRASACAGVNP